MAIKFKVQANQKDHKGDTPLIIHCRQTLVHKADTYDTIKQLASVRTIRETLIEDLIKSGADYEATDENGMTPYLTLMQHNDQYTALIFMKKGANINHKSNRDWNVLQLFVANQDCTKLQIFVAECA